MVLSTSLSMMTRPTTLYIGLTLEITRRLLHSIKSNIVELEKPFIEGVDLTRSTWDKLKDRHRGCGLITQVSLIQEAVRTVYGPEILDLPEHIHKTQDLVSCIYVPGLPSQNTFQRVILLSGLKMHPLRTT